MAQHDAGGGHYGVETPTGSAPANQYRGQFRRESHTSIASESELANVPVKPPNRVPAAQPIEPAAKRTRRKAGSAVKPKSGLPSAPIGCQHVPEDQANRAAGGDVHAEHVTHTPIDIAVTVKAIVEAQKVRRFCVVSQSRCDRSIESLIAQSLGYNPNETETERKAKFRQASDIRKSVEKGGDGPYAIETHSLAAVPSYLRTMILSSAQSRALWDEQRKSAEKEMERLADSLPVAAWARQVQGFGKTSRVSLAIIIGEAGRPLSEFATVSKLWKMLGLAVINGERQRKMTDKEAAAQHGYSPKRRAELYVVGSISLFMQQKPGMKYRDIYDRRRAHTAPRIEATADLHRKHPAKWTPGRCDNDARRIMTKALIADLWGEWRKSTPSN